MMLADPYGVHAELLRVERLRRDVGDELIRRARVIQVVIVAQREVTEVHVSPSFPQAGASLAEAVPMSRTRGPDAELSNVKGRALHGLAGWSRLTCRGLCRLDLR